MVMGAARADRKSLPAVLANGAQAGIVTPRERWHPDHGPCEHRWLGVGAMQALARIRPGSNRFLPNCLGGKR